MPSHLPPPKHDQSKAPSLRRVVLRAFPGTTSLSDSLPASRDFSPPALYARSLPDRLPGRVSPVPRCSVPTCHRLRPRGGPASVPVQDAVCCLSREMSGSALPNTFRLTMWRGCCVHCSLRPAGLLPSFQGLLTLRSARSDLSSRLESATGRSGAYPDRTCTC